ncbi:MAG: hypothetical protein OHK0046_48340 [Anaerolineae bacterium]
MPVFADWTGYLWQAGQRAMLVRPTRPDGDVMLWTVDMDAASWSRLMTGRLSQGIIWPPWYVLLVTATQYPDHKWAVFF